MYDKFQTGEKSVSNGGRSDPKKTPAVSTRKQSKLITSPKKLISSPKKLIQQNKLQHQLTGVQFADASVQKNTLLSPNSLRTSINTIDRFSQVNR